MLNVKIFLLHIRMLTEVRVRCSPCKPPSALCASHLFYAPDLLQPQEESEPYPDDLQQTQKEEI